MKKVLLDTNAYSHLLRGDRTVLETISSADIVLMSIFVLAELYVGFKGGNREKENKQYLKKFLTQTSVQVLNATDETAQIFASIKHNLTQTGNPIPINDVWIASHALEAGAEIITYDAHFKQVQGLRIWSE